LTDPARFRAYASAAHKSNEVMGRALTVVLLVLVLAGASSIAAQFTQYTVPGSLASRPATKAERVQKGAEAAPWNLGPVLLDPRLSIRDLGYDSNVLASPEAEEETSDVHVTVGAGLAAYLNLGPKVYLSGFAAPEYYWWNDLDELRELNLNYGLGVFAFFNRLRLGIDGTSTERQRPLSSEVDSPVQILEEGGTLEMELEVGSAFSLFGAASAKRLRHSRSPGDSPDDLDLSPLDRDVDLAEVGLLMRGRGPLVVGIGIEHSDADFPNDSGGRSNSGTSPLLRLELEGNRLEADARIAFRRLEFDNEELEDFAETTGNLLLSLDLGSATRLSLFSARNLVYGARDAETTIVEDRSGVSLTRAFTPRLDGTAFFELGSSDFDEVGGLAPARRDDLDAWGVALGFDLSTLAVLSFRYSRVKYDSNLDEFDRSSTRWGVGVVFKENLLPW
jgi:hypothetical protein